MVPVALSDVIAVGEVPTAEQIVILANAGFRSLLNTQPDGEVGRLMPSVEVGQHATKAGMAYRHVAIESRRPPAAAIDAFDEAVRTLPRPIYACCYSGARTAAAWALAAARHEDPAKVIEACTTAGYDMSFMKSALAARFAEAQAKSEPAGHKAAATPVAAAVPATSAPAAAVIASADPEKSNGSSARSPSEPDVPAPVSSPIDLAPAASATPAPAAAAPVPALVPSILPRASSAGGFAVSG